MFGMILTLMPRDIQKVDSCKHVCCTVAVFTFKKVLDFICFVGSGWASRFQHGATILNHVTKARSRLELMLLSFIAEKC